MNIVVQLGRLCLTIHFGWLVVAVKITLVKD